MPTRGKIATCTWEACETCRWNKDGCSINSDDFKHDEELDIFTCENYENKAEDML